MILSCILAILGLASTDLRAQGYGYGENHVVLKDFYWKVRSTEHFDIHYYDGSEAWVQDTARYLEKAYADHADRFGVAIPGKLPLFLYADVDDMQQSNIVDVGDGTGGVTEPFKNRFIVYNDGSQQWLDDVLSHELAHEFQFQVLYGGFWKSARILKGFVYPLWMMEGMAEYGTPGLDDATQEIYVRDAATSGGLIPLWKLEHFSHLKPHQVTLAYKSGATAMEFLASQYGPEKVGMMLKLFESHFESTSVLEDLIGTDLFGFDRKWREYLEEKYRRVAREERLREPTAYGVALTTSSGAIPEFNTAPVFTPDGRKMAYFSTRDGFDPILMMKDLETGREERLVKYPYTRIEYIPLGNFDHISRVLAISPNGRVLAFAAQKNHREYFYFYDLKRRKLHRQAMPGFMTLAEPTFSPDGHQIAFSGMKNGVTDIYSLDLKDGHVTQLTDDPQDDQSPSFSPDGGSIVYSSEISVPNDPAMPHQRRLYRLRLADHHQEAPAISRGFSHSQTSASTPGGIYPPSAAGKDVPPLPAAAVPGDVSGAGETGIIQERLLDLPGAARDPIYSRDGGRMLFVLEKGDFEDIYELELGSNTVRRLTRTMGGSFTPTYVPESDDIAFSSFRKGHVHIYRGRRENFLTEVVDSTDNVAPAQAPQEQRLGQLSSPPETSPGDSSPRMASPRAGARDLKEPSSLDSRLRGNDKAKPVLSKDLPGMETVETPQDFLAISTMPAVQTSTEIALSSPRVFRDSASVDLFLPAFFYSSLGGFFWTSYGQASDMLGNHQMTGLVSYNSGAGYLNYQTAYSYARYRPQLSLLLAGVQYRNVQDLSKGLNSNRNFHEQLLGVAYPLDRYHRMEFLGGVTTENVDYPDETKSSIHNDARVASAAFVRDTVGGRYLVPVRGSRLRLQYISAAPVLGGHYRYQTAYGEGHQYIQLGDLSALALRGAAGTSWESNSQQFVLGGLGGVRGYGRSTSENVGSREAIATAELRFPLVKNLDYYMWYIFPDFYFKMISMALFSDTGYVTDTARNLSGAHVRDIRQSYGISLRLHTFILQLFPLVVQLDYARRTTSNGGVFYVYLGPLF